MYHISYTIYYYIYIYYYTMSFGLGLVEFVQAPLCLSLAHGSKGSSTLAISIMAVKEFLRMCDWRRQVCDSGYSQNWKIDIA